jgi:hypothetical protein
LEERAAHGADAQEARVGAVDADRGDSVVDVHAVGEEQFVAGDTGIVSESHVARCMVSADFFVRQADRLG